MSEQNKKTVRIKGEEAPLYKIFNQEYVFEIPPFQRPYSWTEEESGTLFDDLYEFYKDEPDDNYFLGSIVLVKEENKPLSLVIDGQQRLTTLTILLSAIAYRCNNPALKQDCMAYICQAAKIVENIPAQYRLTLRDKDKVFFRTNVQDLRFKEMGSMNLLGLSEPQRHIVSNSLLLLNKLSVFKNDDEITEFSQFLMTRCYIVVVSTPSKDSAFRVFSVMNNRGLELLATDILKADIIGQIENPSKQEAYTEKWENMENELGRDDFNDLIGHIRTIMMKSKAKKSILDEFTENILVNYKGENGSIRLIDEVLDPYSGAFSVITHSNYALSDNPKKINSILKWLNRLDNSDWIPSAMLYYLKYKDRPDHLVLFFSKLERLAAYMRVTSMDITHRIERYALVNKDIENNTNGDFGVNIELTEKEKIEFIDELNKDIYQMTSNKKYYILFRLDSFLSTGDAEYDLSVKSVEHVLPQTPNPNSEWCKIWNDKQRAEWTDKLANLVLLNRRTNSIANNKEFNEKKETYFKVNGTTPFTLTATVLNQTEWTPEVVKKRQEELISAFIDNWDLDKKSN